MWCVSSGCWLDSTVSEITQRLSSDDDTFGSGVAGPGEPEQSLTAGFLRDCKTRPRRNPPRESSGGGTFQTCTSGARSACPFWGEHVTWPWSPPAGPGWGREVSSSRTCFAGGHRFTPLVLRGGGFLASLGQPRHTVGPQSSDPHPAPATSGPGVPGSVDRSTRLPHLAAAWPEPDCMPCLSFPIGQGGTEAAPPHRVRKRNLWPCLGAGPLLSARSPEGVGHAVVCAGG